MRPVRMLRVEAVVVVMMAALGACEETRVVPDGTKVFVVSDPHYHAPVLGTTGAAFDAYAARQGRLIRESAELFAAVRRDIAALHPALLLIPGDLTGDGELVSHQELARQLSEIQSSGTKVLVVPGNHDIDNPNASAWSEAGAKRVPSISRAEFAALYGPFGYASALDRDLRSLSYVAEPIPGLRILALDSTARGTGTPVDGGRIGEDTLAWATWQIAAARASGVEIIGMMHHQLVEHFSDQATSFPGYVVDDHRRVQRTLAEAGLRVILTGHFHATDVAASDEKDGTRIHDIATGSLDSYPCAYRTLDVSAGAVNVMTRTALPRLRIDDKAFPIFAHDRLAGSIQNATEALLRDEPYNLPQTTAAELALFAVDALIAHYVGDEEIPPDTAAALTVAARSGGAAAQAAAALLHLWTDTGPADRELFLELPR